MFSLDFSHSPAFLLLCVAIAGGMAWWMYRRLPVELNPRLLWLLRSLRFAALFLMLALFLEPLWTALFEERRPPIVAVMLDDSESLDAGRDSAYIRRAYPQAVAKFIADLREAGIEVRPFLFGHEAAPTPGPDSLRFRRGATNLGAALRTPAEAFANQNLAAIVLLSDGIATEGNNPVNVLEQVAVPVFTGLVGDTTPVRDVILEEVIHNELSYLNTETPITLRVRGRNVDDRSVQVSLTQGAQTLGAQQVSLTRGNNHMAEATFHVRLQRPGLQQFEAHVQEVPDEFNARNNHRLFFINVLENRLKIAVFGNGPHPDIAALARTFGTDARYELVQFVRRNETEFYTDPNAHPLRAFDLVVFHNFPATVADRPILDRVYAEVERRRLPLLHIVGQNTRLNIHPDQAKHMALWTERPASTVSEAFLYTTPQFRDHSSFRAEDAALFNHWLETAPPLLRSDAEWRPHNGSQVFGKAKIRGIALDYPIMAIAETDGKKNLTFVGEGLWRYRMHAFASAQSFGMFDNWLQNLAQWLTVREDNRRFRVYPLKPVFAGDERVLFRGNVYDESYNPVSGAEIKLAVTDPQNRVLEYYMREASPGAYAAELANLAEGSYRYLATGRNNGRELGADRGQFSVGSSALEFLNLEADANLMRQLALRTGATAHTARTLDALAHDIRNHPTVKPIVHLRRETAPLHRLLWPLLLALALLCTEWVLRKRNGLL